MTYGKNLSLENSGRGLLLYMQSGIQNDLVDLKSEACEYLAVKIKGQTDDLLLVSVYRSPNSVPENNEQVLGLLYEVSEYKVKHELLVGDFNLPNIN